MEHVAGFSVQSHCLHREMEVLWCDLRRGLKKRAVRFLALNTKGMRTTGLSKW